MLFDNQLTSGPRDWSNITFSGLRSGSGVLFEEVMLEARIGPEAVALLIDPNPDELLKKTKLDLNLKTGIVDTAYGPVLFLIWWVAPLVSGRPSVFYEQVMNPLSPNTTVVLSRLSSQTHLHILVVGAGGRVTDLFEYRNIFGFENVLIGTTAARDAWHGPADFQRAQQSYEEDYSIDELLCAV